MSFSYTRHANLNTSSLFPSFTVIRLYTEEKKKPQDSNNNDTATIENQQKKTTRAAARGNQIMPKSANKRPNKPRLGARDTAR